MSARQQIAILLFIAVCLSTMVIAATNQAANATNNLFAFEYRGNIFVKDQAGKVAQLTSPHPFRLLSFDPILQIFRQLAKEIQACCFFDFCPAPLQTATLLRQQYSIDDLMAMK